MKKYIEGNKTLKKNRISIIKIIKWNQDQAGAPNEDIVQNHLT